jgi:hypothetical protein
MQLFDVGRLMAAARTPEKRLAMIEWAVPKASGNSRSQSGNEPKVNDSSFRTPGCSFAS